MKNPQLTDEVKKYLEYRVKDILEFYIRGHARDCQETRNEINNDLDFVVSEIERKFHLKINQKLRARSLEGKGHLVIRFENPDLT